jgi:hypothetical protein
MAVALGVSADLLLFAKDERGPDDELRLQFAAPGLGEGLKPVGYEYPGGQL